MLDICQRGRLIEEHMMTSSNGNIFRVTRLFYAGNSPVSVMFSLICIGTNDWIDNWDAGDLRRHRAHYDVPVINFFIDIAIHVYTYGFRLRLLRANHGTEHELSYINICKDYRRLITHSISINIDCVNLISKSIPWNLLHQQQNTQNIFSRMTRQLFGDLSEDQMIQYPNTVSQFASEPSKYVYRFS